MRNLLIVFVTICLLTACIDQNKKNLPGNWQGIEVLEKNMPLEINAKEIKFWFGNNNQYRYHGTLNYTESGTYHLESKYLYTIDTVNQASTEKAVEIVMLTEDSLFIKMNEAGKERLMKLKKVN